MVLSEAGVNQIHTALDIKYLNNIFPVDIAHTVVECVPPNHAPEMIDFC